MYVKELKTDCNLWCNGPGWEGGGDGVLPYIGYIGMCGAKGYGFLVILV